MGEEGEIVGFSNVLEAVVSYENPLRVHNKITKITIPPNSYNNASFTNLHLTGFPLLKELEIGDNSMGSVSSVQIQEIETLETIHVGASSLYNTTNVAIASILCFY